jgi:tRNA-dihydrouridine synthase A
MMDVTDRHCRFFLRQLSPAVVLYTEMVTARAILHGDRERLLGHDPAEQPVVLQLGGHDPAELAAAARIGAEFGYDEINLNVGCPSDRVRDGRFGACLMLEPAVVADAVAAMRAVVAVPVTVKCRIGVDEQQGFEFIAPFVARVAAAGCQRFIVHARTAMLGGLSPHENRTIPPLRYDMVRALKRAFPQLQIELNGGLTNLEDIGAELDHVDGVMLGRKIADDPWFLTRLHQRFIDPGYQPPDRATVVRRMHDYAGGVTDRGGRVHHVTRPMLGLFHGERGGRAWRRFLAERVARPGVTPGLLLDSLAVFAQLAQSTERTTQ